MVLKLFLVTASCALIACGQTDPSSYVSADTNNQEFFHKCPQTEKLALILVGQTGIQHDKRTNGFLFDFHHEFESEALTLAFGLKKKGYCVVSLFDEMPDSYVIDEVETDSITEAAARHFSKEVVGLSGNGTTYRFEFGDGSETTSYDVDNLPFKYDPSIKISSLKRTYRAETYRRVVGPIRHLNAANLSRAFDGLTALSHRKAKIVIGVFAHGSIGFRDHGRTRYLDGRFDNVLDNPKLNSSEISHGIGLNSDQHLNSDLITNNVNSLSKSGRRINLFYSSCHSGAIKHHLSSSKEENVCVSTPSSAEGLAFGCSDYNFSPSPAAASSMLFSSLFYHTASSDIDKLKHFLPTHQYPCFHQAADFYSNNFGRSKNYFETFRQARRLDLKIQEPSISSLWKYQYFRNEHYNAHIANGRPVPLSSIIADLQELRRAANLPALFFKPMLDDLVTYNSFIEGFNAARKKSDLTREDGEKLELQFKSIVDSFIRKERRLIDEALSKIKSDKNNACMENW